MKKLLGFVYAHILIIELIVCIIIIFFAVLVIHILEGFSYFNSLYYVIITLAGVGYGDIVPYTYGGKLIAICLSILGMPLFFITTSFIIANIFDLFKKEIKKNIILYPN